MHVSKVWKGCVDVPKISVGQANAASSSTQPTTMSRGLKAVFCAVCEMQHCLCPSSENPSNSTKDATCVLLFLMSVCVDTPKEWTDRTRVSCDDYKNKSYCTSSGGYGPGWPSRWGSFADHKSGGKDATQACCACGGGAGICVPTCRVLEGSETHVICAYLVMGSPMDAPEGVCGARSDPISQPT